MLKFFKTNKTGILTLLGLMGILLADTAFAQTTLAWEKPICMIAASLSGPVAKAIAIIIFVLSGLAMAAGEASGIMKTLIMTVFGLSLALMGAQWLGLMKPAVPTAGAAGYTTDAACAGFNAL